MARKEPKEMLRLTVPRRNVMLALLATASNEVEQLKVHIRPEQPEAARKGATKGRLLIFAIGSPDVRLVGGTWRGTWPKPDEFDRFADYFANGTKHRAVVVPADYFTKAKHRGVVATDASVRIYDNGHVTVADDFIGRQWPLARRCPLLLPTWTAGLRPPDVQPWRRTRTGSVVRTLNRTVR